LHNFFGHDYVVGYQTMLILALGQLANAASGSVSLLLNMTRYGQDTARVIAMFSALSVSMNAAVVPILWGYRHCTGIRRQHTTLWDLVLLCCVCRRFGVVSLHEAPSRMFCRSQANP